MKKENKSCKFLHTLDLFGKETEIYYDGKPRLTTCLGIILTLLYVAAYLAFFLYKLLRMINRDDVTFYDSYAFTGEPPNIQLTKEKFYGGFALGNPLTMETFVNNSIYFVKAFYVSGVRNNGVWTYTPTPLDLEICQLDRFGEKYREIFKEKNMDKMHCVPELNHRLEGHLTYDVYSYYLVKFFPCVNQPFCAPIDIVKQYLSKTFVTFKMEDVDLTPQIYNSPVMLRGKEVSASVGKSLFQDVHSFFQVVNIETDEDIVGFEGLNSIKKEKYIKYDQSTILSQLKEDVFTTGDSIVDVTIALSERELTQKRTYPKLITVIGDVGGFMEVFLIIFRVFGTFLTQTLYETSIVNHLFSFDLDRKVVLIKDKKKKKKELDGLSNESPKIFPSNKKLIRKSSFFVGEQVISTKNKLNEDEMLKTKKISDDNNIILVGNKKKKKKKKKHNTMFPNNVARSDSNAKIISLNKVGTKIENGIEYKVISDKEFNENNKDKLFNNKFTRELVFEPTTRRRKNTEKRRIMRKIGLNKACIYFCSCCIRKRKTIENALLDEGMKIITEKLDLMNLFKVIYKEEILHANLDQKFEVIDISDECKTIIQNKLANEN